MVGDGGVGVPSGPPFGPRLDADMQLSLMIARFVTAQDLFMHV